MKQFKKIALLGALLCSLTFAAQKDLVSFGKALTVKKGETVSSVVSVGGDVIINGTVNEDAVSIGGDVILGRKAKIKGKAITLGGKVRKGRGSKIGKGSVEASVDDLNSFKHVLTEVNWDHHKRTFSHGSRLGFIILAMVIVFFLPHLVGNISAVIEHTTPRAALFGVLGFVAIVPLGIMLLMSVIGILLIPFEVALVSASFLFGYVAISQLVGKQVLSILDKKNVSIRIETLVGLLVLGTIGLMPIFGTLVKMVASLLGFGAVLVTLVDSFKRR